MTVNVHVDAKRVLRFVAILGVVNLFADMTYEGARGVGGAFLAHLGASGAAVGAVAGGGELAGYAVRSLSGAIADRMGWYWLETFVGYAINLLCVPALALAGSWPAAAGLMIGERVGRGIRKPVVGAMLAGAGQVAGSGRVFGLNAALDQIGATCGPLIVAFAIARSGFRAGFAVLLVPALLTLACLGVAALSGRNAVPHQPDDREPAVRDWAALRRYAIGGALMAAGFLDFALIAFRFARDHVAGAAAISLWFAVAMAVGAIAAPFLGRLLDRVGPIVVAPAIAVSAAAAPLAFLCGGAAAKAGVALWGVGSAVQDALLLALLAGVVAPRRRATVFGLYDLLFGAAWFAGSVVAGILLDRSLPALALFSVLLQLLAIPFFLSGRKASEGSLVVSNRDFGN